MAKQTIQLQQGGVALVTLFDAPNTWEEASAAITSFEGWDGVSNIAIETVPKLFGKGSYIVSKRLGEIEYTLDASIEQEDVRSLGRALEQAAESLEPITVIVARVVNDISVVESAEVYITALTFDPLDDTEAYFSLTLKNVAGTKTLNGGTIL